MVAYFPGSIHTPPHTPFYLFILVWGTQIMSTQKTNSGFYLNRVVIIWKKNGDKNYIKVALKWCLILLLY